MFILASIVALYIASSVEAQYPTMSLNDIKAVQAKMEWGTISKSVIMNAESGPILDALKYNIQKNFANRNIVLPDTKEGYTTDFKAKLPALFGYGTLAGNAAGAFKAILDLVNSGYPAEKVLIVFGLDYFNGKDWRTNDWYPVCHPVLVALGNAGVNVNRFTVSTGDDPAGTIPAEKTCNENTTERLIKEIAKHGLITLDCWTGIGFQELEGVRIANMSVSTLGLNIINAILHALETAPVVEGSELEIINLSNDVFSGMFANSGKISTLIKSFPKFEGLFSAYISKEFVNAGEAAKAMEGTAVHVMLTDIKGTNGKNFYETACELYKDDPTVVKVMQDYIKYIKTDKKTFVVHKAKSSEIV